MTNYLNNEILNIEILNIVIQETGTYNNQYLRPYETNVQANTLDNFVDRIKETNSTRIPAGAIADLSANILTPSARPICTVPIVNGWDTPRERFLIIVEVTYSVGNKENIYLQGYTDYTGVSTGINNITRAYGAIDPQMAFNINSVSKVNIVQNISNGVILETKRATLSDQVLQIEPPTINNNPTVYGLRPIDIISDINSQWVRESIAYAGGPSTTLDTRTILGASNSNCNRRTNNIPSNYLADFVSSFMAAASNPEVGMDTGEIINECRAELSENNFSTNPFIRFISNSTGTNITNGWFKWIDLLTAFPYAADKVTYIENTHSEYSNIHRTGMTEDAGSMTRESIVAAFLSQTVPAIMVGCLINKLAFVTTNRDIGGLVTTVISNFRVLNPQYQTQSLDLFKSRFEREIYRSISYDNSDVVDLDIKADLYGETWISISINNAPVQVFVYPTFCDSLINPNMVNSDEALHKASSELEILGRTCADAVFDNKVKASNGGLFGHF